MCSCLKPWLRSSIESIIIEGHTCWLVDEILGTEYLFTRGVVEAWQLLLHGATSKFDLILEEWLKGCVQYGPSSSAHRGWINWASLSSLTTSGSVLSAKILLIGRGLYTVLRRNKILLCNGSPGVEVGTGLATGAMFNCDSYLKENI